MTGLNNRTAYENRVEKIRKVTETSRENHEVPEENEKKRTIPGSL